ncbi:hypothetical protein FOZ63_019518 [Perkinsus olseni]|uniref:Fucosyltransferase n=1 Tax=Perkinsus olseni TaxID=32597 RepID=A0A7J6UJ83_PEROL|nr:hypothetical protein FOZ63_019518 [Perkinsus olseni]
MPLVRHVTSTAQAITSSEAPPSETRSATFPDRPIGYEIDVRDAPFPKLLGAAGAERGSQDAILRHFLPVKSGALVENVFNIVSAEGPKEKSEIYVHMWGTQERTQYTNGKPYDCLRSTCHVVGQADQTPSGTAGFDAATYNLRTAEGWGRDMPTARKHVMYVTESPDNTPEAMRRTAANVKFDYTMTYRWDSDVPVQAVHVVHRAAPDMSAFTKNWAEGRSLVVFWFVSNCQTSSGREDIAKEIAGLDMFGACSGRKGCSYVQKKKKPEKYAQCMRDIAAKYRFYLSFENSRCGKYITEKFWRPLWKGNVPVVLGGLGRADYEEIAPPGSFIHVDDFRTTKELSAYLQYLTSNDTAYNEYHHWRAFYEVSRNASTSYNRWCHLCDRIAVDDARLGTDTRATARYTLSSWWFSGTCKPAANKPQDGAVVR